MTPSLLPPIIRIDNLCYTYPDGKQALNGISLAIGAGEKAALVGSNGAGKSTLLLHLNGILTASHGTIEIDGLLLNKKNVSRIRALAGLVFQNPDDQLFSTTVYEDVSYGPTYQGLPQKEVEERVHQALKVVGMESYALRVPYHLSGGEKKRIAIATVLSMQPSILVFDEPTAGLDPRARRELIDLLRTLPQTMLIATHDMEMVQSLTPRTIVLNTGKVAADGATADLLADEALLLQNGLR